MNWTDNPDGFGRMHDSGYGIVMMFLAILFFVAFAWLVIRVAGHSRTTNEVSVPKSHNPSALEIIDMRLAKGEMSKDDYIVARELLEKRP